MNGFDDASSPLSDVKSFRLPIVAGKARHQMLTFTAAYEGYSSRS